MNDKLKFYRSTLVQMTKEAYRKMPNELKIEEAVEEGELLTKAIMKKVDEFEQEKTNMWSPNYDPSYNMTTTIIDHLGFEGNKQKVNPDYLKTEPMRTIVDNGPQYPSDNKEELDYVCKLTQWDIDDLKTRLNRVYNTCKLIHEDKKHADNVSFKAMAANIEDVIDYFDNVNNVRTKSQGLQKARNNQKPYGTLGEHWKELMELFNVKDGYGEEWKTSFDTIIKNYKEHKCASIVSIRGSILDPIADSLGIEFIEDFVKACEKC